MDDAIDQMNKTAKVIKLSELNRFERPMQEMGEIIVRAAQVSMEAIPLLRSLGKQSSRLNVLTEEIIRLEGHSDELHDRGRKKLVSTSDQRDQLFSLVRKFTIISKWSLIVSRMWQTRSVQ